MNNFENFKSQIIIRNQLPFHKLDPDTHFLLYDKTLESIEIEDVELVEFIESFPHRLGLKAGEPLKSFKDFPKNLEAMLGQWPEPMDRSQTLVALGGGSLGDFAGFAASILRRGIPLVHIPTTWLAAMDSAHGGKTGLNIKTIKNQVGTFYPAKKVYIIKEVLEGSSVEIKEQSYGELIKMSLIGESQFFKEIQMEKRKASEFLWRFLKNAIEDKYHVVLQDPYETKKTRQVLNFGHTFGHALEAYFGWTHGDSVMQGVFFALEWSRYRGDLSQGTFDQIMKVVSDKFSRVPAHQFSWYSKPSRKALKKFVVADKKTNSDGKINFVFFKGFSKAPIKPVLLDDLLSEAKRQGWVR